jgi:hypothetical protein
VFKAIKTRKLLREIRKYSYEYGAPLDLNNIADVRMVTPSCEDKREFLFVSPYGWDDSGIVVDKKNVVKLFQSQDTSDVLRLEIDVYEK